MSSSTNILSESLNNRLQLFLTKLKDNLSKFRNFQLNGTLLRIPQLNTIKNKDFFRRKISLPIRYTSNKKYRIRVDSDHIYDLYKSDNNYHFIKLVSTSQFNHNFYVDFQATICNSFIFYLFYTLLLQVTSDGIKVKLHDNVYSSLTKQFNTTDEFDLEIFLSVRPDPSRCDDENKLYLSIFN